MHVFFKHWWNNLSLLMLAVVLIPLVGGMSLLATVAVYQHRGQHVENTKSFLREVSEIRAQQMEQQFDVMVKQTRALSHDATIQEALKHLAQGAEEIENKGWESPDFETEISRFTQELQNTPDDDENDYVEDFDPAWRNIDRVGRVLQGWYIYNNPHPINHKYGLDAAPADSLYNREHAEYHPTLRKFMDEFGYFDVMLVAPDGRIVYTVYKEMDFATSVVDGPYKDTGMAKIAREALALPVSQKDQVLVSDMEPYYTTVRDIGIFIAAPVFAEDGTRLGAVILQVPVDKLVAPLKDRSGLGVNGDIFVIGQDQVMRTPHNIANGLPALAHNASPMAHMIAMGKRGVFDAQNRRGGAILVVARSLNLAHLEWVMVVQQEYGEIYHLTGGHLGSLVGVAVLSLMLAGIAALAMARFLSQAEKKEPSRLAADKIELERLELLSVDLTKQLELQNMAIFELTRAFAALAQVSADNEELAEEIHIALTHMEGTLAATQETVAEQTKLIHGLKHKGNKG